MLHYNPTDYNEFTLAIESVRKLKTTPSDEDMLLLYGLYKQALYGNIKSNQPNIFNVKERRKWSSWKSHAGKGSSKCKKEYIIMDETIYNYI